MKYVMFTHVKTGLRQPVLFNEMLAHSVIKTERGWVATSAGFFYVSGFKTHSRSTSLGLAPCEDDAEICKMFLADMNSMMYVVQNTEDNKRKLLLFCTCGHCHGIHHSEPLKGCAVDGCKCKGFARMDY